MCHVGEVHSSSSHIGRQHDGGFCASEICRSSSSLILIKLGVDLDKLSRMKGVLMEDALPRVSEVLQYGSG